MNELSLESVSSSLSQMLRGEFDRQISTGATGAGAAGGGGVFSEDYGLPDPSHTCTIPLIAGCCLLFLARGAAPAIEPVGIQPAQLLEQANSALDFVIRSQRESGLMDLMSCNIESGPDTAFTVQLLAAILDIERRLPPRDPAWNATRERIVRFIRAAVPGIMQSGFHTPNHRWAIASALAQAQDLLGIDTRATIERYLAEGIDINADGVYIERSPAVYDAVTNRSLLLLFQHVGWSDAVAAVQRNLQFNIALLNDDLTIETGLSRRQDHGQRPVPQQLIHALLMCNAASADPVFVRAANQLWNATASPALSQNLSQQLSSAFWIMYALLRHGTPAPSSAALPVSFSTWFADTRLWRVREGRLAISVFGEPGSPAILKATFGNASIAGLSIRQSYFGAAGDFSPDGFEWENKHLTLHSSGIRHARRPGYEMPLGYRVPPHQWDAALADRQQRRLPPAAMSLSMMQVDGGLDLHLIGASSPPGVLAQIALDFPSGGIWETPDCATKPAADQIIFLRRGQGVMRYGSDEIVLSAGENDAHRYWHMRDAPTAPGRVRVILALITPLDVKLSLRFRRTFS